ncbi:hypothetical protein DFJ74DRAFT_704575 [Hyaloraphidium curvatum]|nr:hypothetical protein DFJ74DRAFT_704575 [Hyaloraphidium curvatum]
MSPFRRDLFRTLDMLARRIVRFHGCFAGGSLALAAAIEETKPSGADPNKERKPLLDGHALVLLLLYHGAEPDHPHVRKNLRSGTGTYKGLRDRIVEAARWRKRVHESNIDNLPPEVKERILLSVWEDEL